MVEETRSNTDAVRASVSKKHRGTAIEELLQNGWSLQVGPYVDL